VHAFAAAPIGIAPRVRWLGPLAAFFLLVSGLLLSAEEADARGWLAVRYADAERVIGINTPALAPRAEDVSPCAVQPAYPAGSLGDLFSRPGLLGGFAAGFLGAGIFGLLFGHGMIGELTGVPSVLGLVFQFTLLVAFAWLIWAWWRADKSAAVAGLSPRQLADAYGRERDAVLPEIGADAKSDTNSKNPMADEARLRL